MTQSITARIKATLRKAAKATDQAAATLGLDTSFGKPEEEEDHFTRVERIFADRKTYDAITGGSEGLIVPEGRTKSAFGLERPMVVHMNFSFFCSSVNMRSGDVGFDDFELTQTPYFTKTKKGTRSALVQKLANGVTRVQLSEDLWATSHCWASATTCGKNGHRLFGVFTLFPEEWSERSVVEATELVRTRTVPKGRVYEGRVSEVLVRVVTNDEGKVISVQPKWDQKL